MYPVIDGGTNGGIHGMVEAADRALKLADVRTRIIPGHGPLADRAALTRYRDMIADTRDRIEKLKTGGSTLEQVLAAKPTASYDAVWGKGVLTPEQYVGMVYETL
jgi:glyoxylase-like metal-dependent hydrolase (beta-lactamase superfamily II)